MAFKGGVTALKVGGHAAASTAAHAATSTAAHAATSSAIHGTANGTAHVALNSSAKKVTAAVGKKKPALGKPSIQQSKKSGASGKGAAQKFSPPPSSPSKSVGTGKRGAQAKPRGIKNAEEVKPDIPSTPKGTVKGEEVVDLYRAVSPAEYDDIMKNKAFRPGPRSYEAKQFGLAFDEILKLSDFFPDSAAIIRARVPKSVFDKLDHTPVDKHILKSGNVTVTPDKYDIFNKSIIEIKHEF